ncbi:MAG TPA: carbon-nitrogen hydrolase family protein [Gaiellaceae bacterium]|nr:carbon-nitrogen hydrolase family protein [Gaiellaceae bacterium]
MTAVRVAAVQAAPVFLDRDATVDKAVTLIAEAAAGGAELVAFPETWIPGYPAWIFGAAGWDDPAQKRVFGRLNANAVEVPSPAVEALCRAAKEAGVVVAMGMTERDARSSRGTLYNSILFVSNRGEVLGVHRKLMPTHAERIVWGQGDGSTLHVFETPVGRVGGLACWEHWMPLTRFAMHAKGEQIHVAAWPEVGDPDLHRFCTRHYAFEGRCFALCVMGARVGPEHLPDGFELAAAMGATDDFVREPAGGTCVFAPDGTVVADSVAGEETIVYADLDLGRIAEEQAALDVVGHYNRPDVFTFSVDERPREPVSSP